MKFVNQALVRLTVFAFVAAPALVSTGCVETEYIDVNTVALCVKVRDGGRVLTGPVSVNATVLRRDTAIVWNYEGDAVLDSKGYGCMNLDNTHISNPYWEISREDLIGNLKVETLTATAEGRTVSGVLTYVDNSSVQSIIYAEAEFDFANTDPGDPGALAILNSLNRSKHKLRDGRSESDAIAVAPEREERAGAGELRRESTSDIAI